MGKVVVLPTAAKYAAHRHLHLQVALRPAGDVDKPVWQATIICANKIPVSALITLLTEP